MMGGGKGGWGRVAAAQRRRRSRENDGTGVGWEKGGNTNTKMSAVSPCNSGGGDALTLLRACVARSCVLASGGVNHAMSWRFA
jgi:hypothetical protein